MDSLWMAEDKKYTSTEILVCGRNSCQFRISVQSQTITNIFERDLLQIQ